MAMQLGEATIQSGSSGAEVKSIQQILQGQGYNVGPVDGLYGPQTQAAVQAFQKAKGLVPDGIVGPLTWQALQNKPVTPTPLPVAAPAPKLPAWSGGAMSLIDTLLSPKVLMFGIGAVALLSLSGGKKRRR